MLERPYLPREIAAHPSVSLMRNSVSTAVRLLSVLSPAAWALAFGLSAPLSAQSSDPYLNYLDHVSLDFAHYTALQSNTALYYHDYVGNLRRRDQRRCKEK